MDPNANIREQESIMATPGYHLDESSRDRLEELRQALYTWTSGGGFEPDWTLVPVWTHERYLAWTRYRTYGHVDNSQMTWQTFETWPDLLAHIRDGRATYYQAPLDHKPVLIGTRVFKNGKIRVLVARAYADPFTADQAHLSRFRRLEHDGPPIPRS